MTNMTHAVFRNTLTDLLQAEEHLSSEPAIVEEGKARLQLIRLCCRIAAEFADEVYGSHKATDEAIDALRGDA